jgi:hypothetical protein
MFGCPFFNHHHWMKNRLPKIQHEKDVPDETTIVDRKDATFSNIWFIPALCIIKLKNKQTLRKSKGYTPMLYPILKLWKSWVCTPMLYPKTQACYTQRLQLGKSRMSTPMLHPRLKFGKSKVYTSVFVKQWSNWGSLSRKLNYYRMSKVIN